MQTARAKYGVGVVLLAACALGLSCLAVVIRQLSHHPSCAPAGQQSAGGVLFVQQANQAREPVNVYQIGCVQVDPHGFCKKHDRQQRIECIVLARQPGYVVDLEPMGLFNAQPAFLEVLGDQV